MWTIRPSCPDSAQSMTEKPTLTVSIIGAGITGVWQALMLAQRGHSVTLREAACEEATGAASRMAGAMLAPYCEAELAGRVVQDLGMRGLKLWHDAGLGAQWRGTLVLAKPRDEADLVRFGQKTLGHQVVHEAEIVRLEPELQGRFRWGLFFPDEGHMAPRRALATITGRVRGIGGQVTFSAPVPEPVWMAAGAGEIVIDCRGIAAREELNGLRGVRGEMAVVHAEGLGLSRPIRLLHPRSAIYVVPWGDDIYMIGATSIESDYAGPVTLRSSLDLLGTACALHPGFAQARVIELSAGVRPAFPDNIPKIIKRGRRLIVNGAYRHGFLLAPVLAEAVANHLEYDEPLPDAFVLRDADENVADC